MANILESPTNIEDEAFEEEINVEREDFELVVPENYDDLLGLPQINGVTLTGNKTSSDLGIITQEQVDNAIQTESQARSSADTELNNKINAESTARGEADTALSTRIDDEALARQQADNGLQTQIDAITSKSDVVDVVANYAALQAYDTSTLGNNDVVKVLDDETHEDALTYYRWSTTTQTWTYIGQEAPYYSKGQMDTKLAEKQDKLTAGANIQIENGTISATDTKYTAGNGLNLNDTEFSADTNVLATKEDLEGYYTKPETDNLLAPKLEAEVVAELPTTGAEGKLYLTPKAHTTQTATGNPITATVAEDAGKIESFQLDGDTYQQNYEGKNLLSAPDYTVTAGSITCVTSDDNKFTVNGTVTESWGFNFVNNRTVVESIPAGSYVLSLSKALAYPVSFQFRATSSGNSLIGVKTINAGSTSETFTLSEAANIFTFWSTASQNTQINDSFAVQIELGSTATSYEPYVGGTPSPNPDYPQPIQTVTGEQTVEIVGKNLFDKTSQISNGYSYSATGSKESLSTSSVQESYIPVLPNTTYTLHTDATSSQTTNFRVFICEYDSDKGFIQRDVPAQTTSNTNTITTTANTYFVRLCFSTVGIDTLQFEKSASPTTYAPYSKQTLPLDLGPIKLNNLGDTYLDRIYKDGENWKIHKATTDRTLSGSTYWATDSLGRYYTNSIADYSRSNNVPVSTHFEGASNVSAMGDMPDGKIAFNNTTTADRLYIGKFDKFTSTSVLTQWLNENSPSICYALATPTDTTLTDQTLIAQLEAIRTASLENGTNTITNTATGTNLAGDMEIGYYGFNPRNRYDKWLWLDINNEYEQIGS